MLFKGARADDCRNIELVEDFDKSGCSEADKRVGNGLHVTVGS